MKKQVLKFWAINLLLSILLFVLYRVVIAETKSVDRNFFENILYILEILLNLGFSVIYLAGMVICSLTILLNLLRNIRNNYLLSLLSFLGLPLICVIYLMVGVLADIYAYHESPLKSMLMKLVIFSIVYLSFTAIAFLMFRRKLKTYELNE